MEGMDGHYAYARILRELWPMVLMVGAGGSALVSKTFGEGDIAQGNHVFTMLIRLTFFAGLINIVLDGVFVALFGWGLTGAAVATALSFLVGGAIPTAYFFSRRNPTPLRFVPDSPVDGKAVGKSLSNGLSEFVGNISFNIVGICYNLQLMRYIGENGVSAYGVLM